MAATEDLARVRRERSVSPARPERRAWFIQWVLALAPALMMAVLLSRAVWDVDIFWQLKLGELILHAGHPIHREPFSITHLGEPLPAIAWLGQALFAQARLLGGWTGLRIFDALCWCGGFWALAAACRRRGASAAATALGLALAFIGALPAASIRPQSFAALCFGSLLALLKLELRTWRTVAFAVPLLVLWQNLHPSVSIAAVALAAHAGGGWLAWFRDRSRPRPWAASLLVPAAGLATLATPDGLSAIVVSARNAQASMLVGASEWLPLWIPANWTNAVPVLAVTLVAVLSLRRRDGPLPWNDIATMAVLLAATITAYRFVLFWAIAVVPVIARPSRQRDTVEFRLPPWIMPAALAAVLAALPVLRPTHFSENLPLAAVARLRATAVTGTIFTEPEFGGVVIDAGYPRWRVSYDGRYYRYTDDEWGRFGQVLDGSVRLSEIERRYRPAAFVLRPSHSTPLCQELDRDRSRWRRIWQDQGAAVWIPVGAG